MASAEESVPVTAEEDHEKSKKEDSIGHIVASHYNNLDERGKEHRKDSRIFHMRNLNNWIKSQLINEYIQKIKAKEGNDRRQKINVLDIGCGKGGDLLKWSKARVSHVVACDIAQTSVEQCRSRYNEMRQRNNRNGDLFTAEFHAADCTKTRLKDLYSSPDIQFDIVSCQFAFHYCFESLPQAECMLRNISENLKPGGYFIGTTPDAYDIVNRIRETGTNGIKNSVYGIEFATDELGKIALEDPGKIPLFGARYNFHLEGVVDCPEFLVHFPTLAKLAEQHGLMMIAKRRFANYFAQFKESGGDLLTRMNALETYPPFEGVTLVGTEETDYDHAKKFLEELEKSSTTHGGGSSNGDGRHQNHRPQRIGTLSLSEWEAASLYIIFAFKKMSP